MLPTTCVPEHGTHGAPRGSSSAGPAPGATGAQPRAHGSSWHTPGQVQPSCGGDSGVADRCHAAAGACAPHGALCRTGAAGAPEERELRFLSLHGFLLGPAREQRFLQHFLRSLSPQPARGQAPSPFLHPWGGEHPDTSLHQAAAPRGVSAGGGRSDPGGILVSAPCFLIRPGQASAFGHAQGHLRDTGTGPGSFRYTSHPAGECPKGDPIPYRLLRPSRCLPAHQALDIPHRYPGAVTVPKTSVGSPCWLGTRVGTATSPPTPS